jgi:hypothetical protein
MFIGWSYTRIVFLVLIGKTKILYITIQWTFLPSLIQICFVVSEKKMKMWNSHRVLPIELWLCRNDHWVVLY